MPPHPHPPADLRVAVEDPSGPDIVALLTEHLADMRANSPEGSMHALDPDTLRHPSVTFWCARQGAVLLGCGALKELDAAHGEIKSMRTATGHTGRGVAGALVTHILAVARERGYRRLSLETGAAPYYRPAIRLYERHGFRRGGPFADYTADPHSVFMTLALPAGADRASPIT